MFTKKYKIFFFLLPLFLISCYEQERNCNDYKTGNFEFTREIDGKMETSYFERNDSLQIETFREKRDTSTVRWVNDCEFILKKVNPKSMSEKNAVQIKILTTTENGYTFEYNIVGTTKKQRGTVTKKQ
ncbi:DNA topoisomerase IV [Flavobacterium jejuense]|uniref:DNA topoisomerase IV n=1 Tax=Flavobacterium jejuense TaxID=1544455 RepID=A0ABX0IM50_9FLAO|nr:DNA topoisomerase IV [Flavobacterium jejuense]NHN24666.1 DNA topoisomerase IV [Flavobacterium jejuense]